jgi:hypothetical protein
MNSVPPPLTSPADFARRLALILAPLAALVAARFRLLGPITVPLWTRLTRASRRLARLMVRLESGKPRPHRPGRRGGPRPPRLPNGHAWLVRALRHEAAAYALQLDALLAEPATQDLLAAAPTAARTLRPICRMLGLDPPALRRPPAAIPAPEPEPEPSPPPPPTQLGPTPPRLAPAPRFTWLTARNLTAHFLKPA